MQTNNYEVIKQYIFGKLNNAGSPLERTKIVQEIQSIQTVIATVNAETLPLILPVNDFTGLPDGDWERMSIEFEKHFDVEMKHGILIQGDEQQNRDNTWWTAIFKQKTVNFYWDRYRKYLGNALPPDVVKTIDTDTDIVMNNLENPIGEPFSRYGMVVGHVQSGKTGNYSALICKAADAGYKFIVVIAGGINNLRDQTQERLNESFIGQTKGVQVGAGIGNTQRETMPLSLTTIERDFNKQDADRLAHGLNFETINVPVLLVIKKNTRTLENVIDWLDQQYKGKGINHAMLVIDDESDYASINTKEEEDPTKINLKLRILLSLFKKYAYVAYTATPYANIFIDHEASHDTAGQDLFPKDFIYALDAPSNYFGARKIFIENADKYLIPITDNEESIPYSHKKDFTLDELPDSLLEAIRLFTLVIAVRHLRGQRGKHNSMLIHATRFTDVHKLLAALTEEYLSSIKKDVAAYASLPDALTQSAILNTLKATFEKHLSKTEFSWHDIMQELPGFSESIVVREVHQKKSVPLEYRKDIATNAIVIGGASLARGFTVEGLSVSYFLRNTVFYDTLMQMGRWFGYRPGYEDLCRIYMPADRITDFANIIEATENLILDFKLMAEQKKTPNDFGLAIQQSPDSALQVTARNKLKNVREFFFNMRLDGTLKETSYLLTSREDINHNLLVVKNLLDELPAPPQTTGTRVWKNVSKSLVRKFIKDFKTFDKDKLGLTSRMPIGFIKQYLEERATDWDIALYNGTGTVFEHGAININKERRQISINASGAYEVLNRQVSSGNSESVSIEDEDEFAEIGNNRRKARASVHRLNPLLMLHILETETEPIINEIAAFGISFSGTVLSTQQPTKLLINTVYYQNLFDSMNLGNDSDD
ncbi:Z1 domain-containing protein [Mucilaginibacter sp. SMC90]|uniref:Z1 domain-containing protein n=1 Tax=Mucilaginibacter sp. SMC90 TaxID=2929803 RepID=UPI001FB2F6DE|nr:Z1 domain-containing protein [Mucilaginibacter sp. SMC90]UOE49150.1 Z1 domain-containing protein [Mucilaginibacter sp. SMC90]